MMSPFKKYRRAARRRATSAAGRLASTAIAAAGGWILYSNLGINHELPLTDALPAERKAFYVPGLGRLNYYSETSAQARPVVLLHSINAAASAYEMRPLFLHYQGVRPVYALDWPGYGFSERADRDYTPQMFVDGLLAFLETVVGQPADVVALSLGCEFAATAALAQPERFHSLVLISPSGFNLEKSGSNATQESSRLGLSEYAHRLLAFPLWGRPFYDLLATRPSIEYFLKLSFVGPVPLEFIEYDYVTSHQPGAEHAPLTFVSGKLFTPHIREQVYERLHIPTLVLFDQDAFVRFDMLPDLLAKNTDWRARRIAPTKGLPQFEKLAETTQALNQFWQGEP